MGTRLLMNLTIKKIQILLQNLLQQGEKGTDGFEGVRGWIVWWSYPDTFYTDATDGQNYSFGNYAQLMGVHRLLEGMGGGMQN